MNHTHYHATLPPENNIHMLLTGFAYYILEALCSWSCKEVVRVNGERTKHRATILKNKLKGCNGLVKCVLCHC